MVERGLEGLEGGSDRRETASTEMALWDSGHEMGLGGGWDSEPWRTPVTAPPGCSTGRDTLGGEPD